MRKLHHSYDNNNNNNILLTSTTGWMKEVGDMAEAAASAMVVVLEEIGVSDLVIKGENLGFVGVPQCVVVDAIENTGEDCMSSRGRQGTVAAMLKYLWCAHSCFCCFIDMVVRVLEQLGDDGV
ncbi:hypothetical protein RIF29_20342 [Crotalaria pallida]|uniref:Uncharacterized protein n=1 Tax=Crotalaria pallida TaxID=3830 RepID=A0AAN9F2S1_CROPI